MANYLYILGKLTRAVYPNGAPPAITDIAVVQPTIALGLIMRHVDANKLHDRAGKFLSMLPADLQDPKNGIKIENQGPFWLGYFKNA